MGIFYFDLHTGAVRRSIMTERRVTRLIQHGWVGGEAIYFFAEQEEIDGQ